MDINQKLEQDWMQLIIEDLGVKTIRTDEENKKNYSIPEIVFNEQSVKKIPVICVVGHIDHGKTSLLDRIKKTNLANREVGGITQSIGAYTVEVKKELLTFIDTPGHAAFDNMRINSLSASDYAILIISVVDGIQPQTVQAIKDLQLNDTPFIIALTKCDLQGNMNKKIKESITQYNVIPEEFGGEVKFIEVSSTTGHNIDLLLNTIVEETDLLELKANNDKENIQGVIVESIINPKIGVYTSVIVKNGILNLSDIIINDVNIGKVKALIDHNGKNIKEALPGMPVQILGLSEPSSVGSNFYIAKNLSQAEEMVRYRRNIKSNILEQAKKNKPLFGKSDMSKINIIIKSGTQGSLQALYNSVIGLSNDSTEIVVVQQSIGGLKDSWLALNH